MFQYDAPFVTLFYEKDATSRFIKQKIMFNLYPIKEYAKANGVSDVRRDPFAYTYFYGLMVHKLGHFWDVVHGTRHNFFMTEYRAQFVEGWLQLLEARGFDPEEVENLEYGQFGNVSAAPGAGTGGKTFSAKDHLWSVTF